MENTVEIHWATKFIESPVFLLVKSILETSSYVVSIIGVIAIAITVVQYANSKRERDYEIGFKKKEVAVEILNRFAQEIIPSINKLEAGLRSEFEGMNLADVHPEKISEIKLYIKMEKGIIDIFNHLEQVSVYIKSDIVDTEILFDPISSVMCNFADRHADVFTELLTRSPYSNLTYVVDHWSKEKQIQFIEKQEKALSERKKELNSKR